NQRLDSVRGTWWHPESRVPALYGLTYRLRQYDPGNPIATEWIYFPDASGALPTGPLASRGLADDGKPIRWIAFSPAFNAAFIRAVRTVAEGDGALTLVAVGVAILLIVTAAGLRFDAIPRWLM